MHAASGWATSSRLWQRRDAWWDVLVPFPFFALMLMAANMLPGASFSVRLVMSLMAVAGFLRGIDRHHLVGAPNWSRCIGWTLWLAAPIIIIALTRPLLPPAGAWSIAYLVAFLWAILRLIHGVFVPALTLVSSPWTATMARKWFRNHDRRALLGLLDVALASALLGLLAFPLGFLGSIAASLAGLPPTTRTEVTRLPSLFVLTYMSTYTLGFFTAVEADFAENQASNPNESSAV